MSEIAIRADNLSKRFRVHGEKRTALKERIVRGRAPASRDFWALRNASFEIEQGQTFGIIGHNGSGKSTALKVLTGVYRPTSGQVTVHGRVSALLELGAGFHPELTGRENIRLNGAILGLGRRQIDGLMDEIVDFSGIEPFIDSPVKVYSSGMFVRLGFAIAVTLEPEILIVDEIIAVGDEEFQRKCFDHLYTLRQDGCTIVLVSHAMTQIQEMCDQAVWLSHGEVQHLGPARETVQHYLDAVNNAEIAERAASSRLPLDALDSHPGSGEIRVSRVEFLDATGTPADVLQSRAPATVRLHYRAKTDLKQATFGVMFHTEHGVPVAGRNSTDAFTGGVPAGRGWVDYEIPDLLLHNGLFRVTTMISERSHIFDSRQQAFMVTVRASDLTTGGSMMLPGVWRAPHPDEPAT